MTAPLEVLIVEDNPADAELIRELLPESGPAAFALAAVQRLADAIAWVREHPVELVLLDLGLPDSQGLETFHRMKAAAPEVPVVVLSGRTDQEFAVTAVREGAQDYLLKGHTSRELLVKAMLYAVERKRAQVAVERASQQWERTFDAVPELIALVDARCRVSRANRALADHVGDTPAGLVGRCCCELVRGREEPIPSCPHAGLQDLEARQCAEAMWRRLGEGFETTVTPLLGEAGSPVGSVHVARDISERKRAEVALRESERWHRLLFQQSRDALLTLAPPGWGFTSANAAAVDLFGARDESDLLERTWAGVSPETQPGGRSSGEKAEAMVQVALERGTHLFDWTHRTLDGRDFPATVLLTRIEIGDRLVVYATIRDESEKRAMQASVAQSDRLASMGMLAAGVAHEINNPLSYVLYNVESLADELPGVFAAAQRAYQGLAAKVGDAAAAGIAGADAGLLAAGAGCAFADRAKDALSGLRRIKDIARGLGAFSRVEQARPTLVDLRVSAQDAVNLARNEIKYRARLVQDFGEVPKVLATEGQLAQVFLNLLVNAAHAIEPGHLEANHISVRIWTEAGDVLAEVADTGTGIPPENLTRIFDAFFTTKAPGVGTGLGLSICKNILTRFGGGIRVESEVGKGTRFVVRLPAAHQEEVAEPALEVPRGAALPAARGRLLIVDDEAGIRRAMSRALGEQHEVLVAGSGEEARALLELDRDFDALLCDLIMPRVSGMELHQWLATIDPALASRTVFVSGGALTPEAAEYVARVGNLLVEKPMEREHLRAVVRERVAKHRQDRGSAGAGDGR